MNSMVRTACLTLALLAGGPTVRPVSSEERAPGMRPIPSAIGPHVGLKPADFAGSRSFGADERVVMTYYFYWYDVESKSHLVDGDGSDALTTHPVTLKDFSYKSVAWHKRQLRDMKDAGIDVALPVYWGAPSERDRSAHLHWSFAGLGPLVEAAEQLERAGHNPPRIGLFYDTSTLRHNAWGAHVDLTTDYGREWFYASIRDFFSLIPPRMWAMIDGRPIVGLYSASFAKAHDQRCIDYVRQQFAKDFGGRVPYIIREVSWNVRTDSVYKWGGAIRPTVLGIGELGPGYDHSSVPGRAPLVVPRQGGAFYEEGWRTILRRSPKIVAIETWNEFHEGTDIADSREYGRQYIELTRRYADRFHGGWRPPEVAGPYAHAKSIEVLLGKANGDRGLTQVDHDDGMTEPAQIEGRECRATRSASSGGGYIYFIVDDSFKRAPSLDVMAEVEYFDGGRGSFSVDYDSHDVHAPLEGAYARTPDRATLAGSGRWKVARFALKGARFANAQNAGADLRIAVDAPRLHVRRVTLTRIEPSKSPRNK